MRYNVVNPILRFYFLFLVAMVPLFAFAGTTMQTEAGGICNGSCLQSLQRESQSLKIPPEKVHDAERSIARLVKNAMSENAFMKKQVGNNCDGLFASEDKLGPLGQLIFEKAGEYPALMTGPSDLGAICPRLNSSSDPMSPIERRGLYVVLLEGMAALESSCKIFASNSGATEGTGYGLFQLLKNHESTSGGPACRDGDSLDAQRSAICTVSTLNYQITNHEGHLFGEKITQWQILHPREPKHNYLAATLNSYGPCQYSSDDPNL